MSAIFLSGTIGFANRPERFAFSLSIDEEAVGETIAIVRLADDLGGNIFVCDGEDAHSLVAHVAAGIEDMTSIQLMHALGAFPPVEPEAA